MKQIQQIFEKLFDEFTALFPNLIGAIILIGLGWAIAKVFSTVVEKILVTIKADRLTEKLQEVDLFAKANVEIRLSSIFAKTIYYFIFLTFIIAATEFLGLKIISEQVSGMLNLIPKIITATMVFMVGVIFANGLKNIIDTAFRSLGIPSGKLISSAVFYFLVLTISITALSQTGMDTDFLTKNIQILLIGIVVAFSIGFGFSSRTLLKNILAANYTRQKFLVGMTIKIDDTIGIVLEMDNTAVVLEKEGGHQVVIPQIDIINNRVEILGYPMNQIEE